jgi:hypothetical protein
MEMAIEIIDLPIILMMIFHSYVKLPEGIKYPIWANYIFFTNLESWAILG